MIVIHIESGLGNQMLGYLEYLAAKMSNPLQDCYIETILYEIPACSEVVSQWNGYEVDEIFGFKTPNIRDIFSNQEWDNILRYVTESEFWNNNWSYAKAILEAFKKVKPELKFNYVDPWEKERITESTKLHILKHNFLKTKIGYEIKKLLYTRRDSIIKRNSTWKDKLFFETNENFYGGFTLMFRFIGVGIERFGNLNDIFKFPKLDDKNDFIRKKINSVNSVAIHARRGDMLGVNEIYYKYGYFKKAVKFIKRRVENPEFFIFCDSKSVEWCKNNLSILGLNNLNQVCFVNWNSGKESYKDMQLMANCKHNIITNSTFGLWGAWLNPNKNKITCSPEINLNTTHHF